MRLPKAASIPLTITPWKTIFPFFVTLLVTLLITTELAAQRITYESLRLRDRQPNVFVDQLILPELSSGEKTIVTSFRIEHNFLTFRNYRGNGGRDPLRQFYSEPSVRVSVRKTTEDQADSRRSGTVLRRNEQPVSGEIVATSSWSETVFTETFEQTQSSGLFVQNLIRTSLPPGRYHIETAVTANGSTRRDHVPAFRVPDTSTTEAAYFYFLDNPSERVYPVQSPLMNMGNNVYFGRDHQLAVWLPKMADDARYTLEVHQLRIQQRDTTIRDMVFEHTFNTDHLLEGYQPEIYMDNGQPYFALHNTDEMESNGTFYLVHIPNSTFANAHFRVRLTKTSPDNESRVLDRRTYQSLWLDMPVSLYNLDVAINMMRFIVDDETLRSLRRGSRQEREQRFRDFWSQRDPSPDKEYNELMVEYFRRIDYAFERFTTPQKPGYESDQGKIYITNGEPDRRERTFPPNQPARETWHYGSRTFVFEATTGFGDYRLVERK